MKFSMSRLTMSFVVLTLLFSASMAFMVPVIASPAWYNLAWTRRKPVIIDNTLNPNNLVDYQVKINVAYDSDMNSDFSDLRFTDSDEVTLIPYWIQSYTASVSALVWVKVPSIPASSSKSIYMYYGNPSASSMSDGGATFNFFDDFETAYSTGWSDKQLMPSPKSDLATAVYNDKLYAFGGYYLGGSDPRKETYEYDPSLDTWSQKADMPTARWGPVAVEYNGKIYVFAGTVNKNEVYDPATDTWDTTKVNPPLGIGNQGLMGVRYGTKIHLFYKSNHYEYDPVTDAYTPKANVPTPRTWGTCAVVGNKIYVIGGYSYGSPSGATDVNEVYDPSMDSWDTTKASMPDKLYGVTRENPVINNKIYVTHGKEGGFFVTNYVYDPSTDTWEQKSSASHARDGVGCGVINDKLYVVGGRADGLPTGLNYNEEYDPLLDTGAPWTFSNPDKVKREPSAKYEGDYGLLIYEDVVTSPQYAEHTHNFATCAVDLYWQMTDALGIATVQPQGRILLADSTAPAYGSLYYYNDNGAKFKWYTGSFTTLQSGSWNTWYHITIIWDGANSKVIINGIEHSVSATSINSDRIYLGTYMHTRMYFDLVRVRKYSSPEPTTSVGEEESAPPAPPVGGVWTPINKFELLAPWIGLASLIAVVAVCVGYVRHRKKKQIQE